MKHKALKQGKCKRYQNISKKVTRFCTSTARHFAELVSCICFCCSPLTLELAYFYLFLPRLSFYKYYATSVCLCEKSTLLFQLVSAYKVCLFTCYCSWKAEERTNLVVRIATLVRFFVFVRFTLKALLWCTATIGIMLNGSLLLHSVHQCLRYLTSPSCSVVLSHSPGHPL